MTRIFRLSGSPIVIYRQTTAEHSHHGNTCQNRRVRLLMTVVKPLSGNQKTFSITNNFWKSYSLQLPLSPALHFIIIFSFHLQWLHVVSKVFARWTQKVLERLMARAHCKPPTRWRTTNTVMATGTCGPFYTQVLEHVAQTWAQTFHASAYFSRVVILLTRQCVLIAVAPLQSS